MKIFAWIQTIWCMVFQHLYTHTNKKFTCYQCNYSLELNESDKAAADRSEKEKNPLPDGINWDLL